MNTRKRITRREFIKGTGITLLGTLLGRCTIAGVERATHAQDPTLIPRAYLPLVTNSEPTPIPTSTPTPTLSPTNTPVPGTSRVVHVHDPDATSWDFGDDYYGNFVDQAVVNDMVDRGMMELTGASTVADAWRAIIPNYTPGEGIAIKVNFNNSLYCDRCLTDCEDWQLKIDALIHPINALIRGLKLAYPSLDHSDVWVYDATVGDSPPVSQRGIPNNRFADRCLYSGVQFFDARGCDNYAGYDSSDPTAYITWHNPQGIPTPATQKITDVLINATYLINMPIIKKHGQAGVTLSFKNHFGSIDNCPALHDYVRKDGSLYTATYNPLVDIYRNPHVLNKTVLTIGDGLFGDRIQNDKKPTPWNTFGGQAPNSLFFATDPVAIDCVMCDFLHIEGHYGGVYSMSDDYLKLAEAAGLGTYERGDPWGSEYSQIDYRRINL